MTEFSWKKLDDGEWGVRVWDGPQLLTGEIVTVKTKAGKAKQVKLGHRLSHDRKAEIYEIDNQVALDDDTKTPRQDSQPLPDVPAGRYAFPIGFRGQETWVFVRIWRGTRNPNVVRAYMQKGDPELGLEDGGQMDVREALTAIERVGVLESAQQFGHRTGRAAGIDPNEKLDSLEAVA